MALTCAFLLVGSLLLWRGHPLGTQIFFSLAFMTVILVAATPQTMKYPIYVFMGIGWFNTKLILVVTFFLVITPVGLVMRLLGKDPLDKKWNVDRTTYWIERDNSAYPPEHLERPF